MKKYVISTIVLLGLALFIGCTSSKIAMKSGAQLWGENCIRCHNAPPPSQFDDREWSTIGSHMEITANLTNDEIGKIVEFLQSAN
ncbi:MAG: cytochrome c [Bacteroidetes bacterium]|nr:MAG: cytochrome c [Bacteroidota bacterium]